MYRFRFGRTSAPALLVCYNPSKHPFEQKLEKSSGSARITSIHSPLYSSIIIPPMINPTNEPEANPAVVTPQSASVILRLTVSMNFLYAAMRLHSLFASINDIIIVPRQIVRIKIFAMWYRERRTVSRIEVVNATNCRNLRRDCLPDTGGIVKGDQLQAWIKHEIKPRQRGFQRCIKMPRRASAT